MSDNTDLFVVGGGPAGLALAIAASRRGMSVTVADGAMPPIDKPCGEGLMPEGLAALHSIGVDVPPEAGHPFRGIRFLDNDVSVAADFPQSQGHALGIRRTVLHQIMIDRAADAGVRMLWQTPIEDVGYETVQFRGRTVRCRWIAGADGSHSRVRAWANLDRYSRNQRRFGFRRHYKIAPWSDCVELYWGEQCQLYVTPVASDEICVAAISPNQWLRLDGSLDNFPALRDRLAHLPQTTRERGSVTATRRLKEVYRGRIALLGDASGSVDAITGEGLSLAFRQAPLLADCFAEDNLDRYQTGHRRMARLPNIMSDMLLLLGERSLLRHRTIRAMSAKPPLFANMLAMHVGALSNFDFAANSLALGWQMLTI